LSFFSLTMSAAKDGKKRDTANGMKNT